MKDSSPADILAVEVKLAVFEPVTLDDGSGIETTGQSWSFVHSDGLGTSGRRGYKWCRKAVPEGGE